MQGYYDDDGSMDIAVYNPESGTWYILESGATTAVVQVWGWSEAEPIDSNSEIDDDGYNDEFDHYYPHDYDDDSYEGSEGEDNHGDNSGDDDGDGISSDDDSDDDNDGIPDDSDSDDDNDGTDDHGGQSGGHG